LTLSLALLVAEVNRYVDSSGGETRAPTATPMANQGSRRHVAARGEFESPLLNERRRSVNRKVQGSSPCPGANLTFKIDSARLLEMMRSRFA